jgi:hypothetical protein
MKEPTGKLVSFPEESSRDVLTQILHDGAREMLARAINDEVRGYLAAPWLAPGRAIAIRPDPGPFLFG